MTLLKIEAWAESWPIAGSFVISRGPKRAANVVIARLSDGNLAGRGECVPYAHYGETVDSVLEAIAATPADGLDHMTLARRLPAGAARNALDCALWGFRAKRGGPRGGRPAGS